MIEETTAGSMNYNVLCNLLKQGHVVRQGVGAEIGVLYGDTSAYLLSEIPTLTLISVDPFLEYAEEGVDRSQATMSKYEQITREKLAQFGSRSRLVKDTSLNAAQLIEDRSLDFVFIDADHHYESVVQDIAAWAPKVRVDGIIAGHDYRSFEGVTRAVNEFSAAHALNGFCTPIASDLWFFVKPATLR